MKSCSRGIGEMYRLAFHLSINRVISVLISPLPILVWSPERYLLLHKIYFTRDFVRINWDEWITITAYLLGGSAERRGLSQGIFQWLATGIFTFLNNRNARHCNLVCIWLNNEVHEIHLIKLIRRISSIGNIFVAYHQRIITLIPL